MDSMNTVVPAVVPCPAHPEVLEFDLPGTIVRITDGLRREGATHSQIKKIGERIVSTFPEITAFNTLLKFLIENKKIITSQDDLYSKGGNIGFANCFCEKTNLQVQKILSIEEARQIGLSNQLTLADVNAMEINANTGGNHKILIGSVFSRLRMNHFNELNLLDFMLNVQKPQEHVQQGDRGGYARESAEAAALPGMMTDRVIDQLHHIGVTHSQIIQIGEGMVLKFSQYTAFDSLLKFLIQVKKIITSEDDLYSNGDNIGFATCFCGKTALKLAKALSIEEAMQIGLSNQFTSADLNGMLRMATIKGKPEVFIGNVFSRLRMEHSNDMTLLDFMLKLQKPKD